ncbi:MAG: hypothetical protein E7069_05590 [Bacteroidales bacterium]|nr:hypothetical protein [Bacteroidales bacterium]
MKNFLNIIRYELAVSSWRFYIAIALTCILSINLWTDYAQADNHVLSNRYWEEFDIFWFGAMFMLSGLFNSTIMHKNAFASIRQDIILLPCNRWSKLCAIYFAEVILPTLALILSRYVALLTFDPQLIISVHNELFVNDSNLLFTIFSNILLFITFPLYWLFCAISFRTLSFIKALLILIVIIIVAVLIVTLIWSYCGDEDIYQLNYNNLYCWLIASASICAICMAIAIKRRYERLEV